MSDVIFVLRMSFCPESFRLVPSAQLTLSILIPYDNAFFPVFLMINFLTSSAEKSNRAKGRRISHVFSDMG
jgi:hypothetical protein